MCQSGESYNGTFCELREFNEKLSCRYQVTVYVYDVATSVIYVTKHDIRVA